MSDTNKISIEFSKDFQPLIQTAFDDFRQYLKDKAKNELAIEQAKIKATKEKWDAALKTLNRNGTLDSLMIQLFNRVMGEPVLSPKINTSGKTAEDYANRVKNAKSERAEKTSLVSLVTKLNEHLDSDPEFKMSLMSVIKQTSINESMCNLLKCTSEDDAILTLKYIKFNMSTDDFHYLIKLNDALTSTEKDLVEKIVNFEV